MVTAPFSTGQGAASAVVLQSIAVTPVEPECNGHGADRAVHRHRYLLRQLDGQPHLPGDLGVGTTSVATITSGGLATGVATGTTTITATLGRVTGPPC